MNTRNWIYLTNPFDTATRNSYKKAVGISTFHFNALTAHAAAVPTAATLLSAYTPLHTQLLAAYNGWQGQGGTQEGLSLNLNQLLDLLSGTRINDWDVAIQGVYNKNTPTYKNLMPDRRLPFQQGTQQQRMDAVKILRDKTATDPALTTLNATIAAYYTQLSTAFDTQKQSISTTNSGSTAVEAARVAICTAQYANLGALIYQYAATPDAIADYFDLANIRAHNQAKFIGSHLAHGATQLIVQHTFANGDGLRLRNTGAGALEFYLGATATAPAPAHPFTIQPGEDKVAEAAQLGALTDAFVFVHNPDAALEGSWKVDIL